jgi:hypothetical protein
MPEDVGKATVFYSSNCQFSYPFAKRIERLIAEVAPHMKIELINEWMKPQESIRRHNWWLVVNTTPIQTFFMEIEIQLVPSPPNLNILLNQAVVVIDVLRATSVMIHALSQGVSEIIPVSTVDEAFQMSKGFTRSSILLGGERESKKIQGFDLGNSPREYVAERVRGKKLILTTTNGTKAFHTVDCIFVVG